MSDATTETQAPAPQANLETLQADVRLSDSMMWRLQEEYYDNLGISAWEQVPFHVTSNAYIGAAYADMIVAFLRDARDSINPDEPIYILELAAGTGCMSHFLMHALMRKMAYFRELRDLPIRFIVTDFTRSNLEYWGTNPKLVELRDAGLMDFAIFKPEYETSLTLENSGVVISAETVKNPIIAIANYFFDSIRQDLFQIEQHQLKEIRVSLSRDTDKYPEGTPIELNQVKMDGALNPVSTDYYHDADFDGILSTYTKIFTDASIVFPLGALCVLKNLRQMGNGNLAILSADKGYTDPNYMLGHWMPSFALHGSFSYMVNYDAIRRFFQNTGGWAEGSGETHQLIKVFMGITLAEQKPLETVRYTFEEVMQRQNPVNNLFYAKGMTASDTPENAHKRLRGYMALANLSHNDPVTLNDLAEQITAILRVTPNREYGIEEGLGDLADKARALVYPLRQGHNAHYQIAWIYYFLNRHQDALDAIDEGLEVHGIDDCIAYLQGCCLEMLNHYEAAINAYELAAKLDPNYAPYQESVERVKQSLNG